MDNPERIHPPGEAPGECFYEADKRHKMAGCSHCDGQCGSAATYAGQACMPLKGRVRSIDWCIHHIVAALNAGGVETVASCCGHGRQDGDITLADGRTLIVKATHPLLTKLME